MPGPASWLCFNMYAGADGTLRQRAYRVQAVDTTGAGDTFTGFFLACAAASIPTMAEVRAANLAADDLL